MRRRWLLLVLLLCASAMPRTASAQLPDCTLGGLLPLAGDVYVCTADHVFTKLVPTTIVNFGPALPGTCLAGAVFTLTSGAGSFSYCNPANTWNTLSASSVVPTGALLMIVSGSCPTGYTESASMNGRTVIGTLAANANVGTTGGADSVTPTGTISAPVFTGSPMATHAHELPWQIPTTTTIRQIAVGTFGTGTSRAATAVSAAGTANTTSAAVALTQAVTAGTPAGTNSAPSFTGTAIDNRSAFIRGIFCRKN